MNGLFTKYSHAMSRGEIVSGWACRASTLHMASGAAWVTIEGSMDDYWLSAGDMLPVSPGRLVVVEADQMACRITVRSQNTPDTRINLRHRIGALMHRHACA
jgi:hypothetical protein